MTLSFNEGSIRLLSDLEELGDTELFLKNQNSTEIFCFVLHLLPCSVSTFRQTNYDKTRNDSEDDLLFSRFQSLHHCLEVDLHDEEHGSISSTLDNRRAYVFLVQHRSKFFHQKVLFLWTNWQNLVFVVLLFDRLAKSPAFNLNAYSSNCTSEVSCSLSSWSLLLKSVTNLIKPREFLTHEWELCLFADSILISTPYFPCKQQVETSNTSPILVFPRFQPFGSDVSSSVGKVYSRQATGSVNCENSSVSFVMKYCPTSTVVRNHASVQNLLNLSCCDNFSLRSPDLCNRRSLWARSSLSKSTSVLITLGTNEELDCPLTAGCPVLSWNVPYSSHISATAQQNVVIVFCLAQWWIDNFPPPLLLSWPLDRRLVARKTGCPLSANSNNILSATLSHSPCGLSALTEYHFFSDPSPRNDHYPVPHLFAYRETSRAFDSHFFIVSWSTRDVVEHRHEDNSSCEILWCLIESQFCPKFCIHMNHSNLSSHAVFDWGFSCILPRHNTGSEKT